MGCSGPDTRGDSRVLILACTASTCTTATSKVAHDPAAVQLHCVYKLVMALHCVYKLVMAATLPSERGCERRTRRPQAQPSPPRCAAWDVVVRARTVDTSEVSLRVAYAEPYLALGGPIGSHDM